MDRTPRLAGSQAKEKVTQILKEGKRKTGSNQQSVDTAQNAGSGASPGTGATEPADTKEHETKADSEGAAPSNVDAAAPRRSARHAPALTEPQELEQDMSVATSSTNVPIKSIKSLKSTKAVDKNKKHVALDDKNNKPGEGPSSNNDEQPRDSVDVASTTMASSFQTQTGPPYQPISPTFTRVGNMRRSSRVAKSISESHDHPRPNSLPSATPATPLPNAVTSTESEDNHTRKDNTSGTVARSTRVEQVKRGSIGTEPSSQENASAGYTLPSSSTTVFHKFDSDSSSLSEAPSNLSDQVFFSDADPPIASTETAAASSAYSLRSSTTVQKTKSQGTSSQPSTNHSSTLPAAVLPSSRTQGNQSSNTRNTSATARTPFVPNPSGYNQYKVRPKTEEGLSSRQKKAQRKESTAAQALGKSVSKSRIVAERDIQAEEESESDENQEPNSIVDPDSSEQLPKKKKPGSRAVTRRQNQNVNSNQRARPRRASNNPSSKNQLSTRVKDDSPSAEDSDMSDPNSQQGGGNPKPKMTFGNANANNESSDVEMRDASSNPPSDNETINRSALPRGMMHGSVLTMSTSPNDASPFSTSNLDPRSQNNNGEQSAPTGIIGSRASNLHRVADTRNSLLPGAVGMASSSELDTLQTPQSRAQMQHMRKASDIQGSSSSHIQGSSNEMGHRLGFRDDAAGRDPFMGAPSSLGYLDALENNMLVPRGREHSEGPINYNQVAHIQYPMRDQGPRMSNNFQAPQQQLLIASGGLPNQFVPRPQQVQPIRATPRVDSRGLPQSDALGLLRKQEYDLSSALMSNAGAQGGRFNPALMNVNAFIENASNQNSASFAQSSNTHGQGTANIPMSSNSSMPPPANHEDLELLRRTSLAARILNDNRKTLAQAPTHKAQSSRVQLNEFNHLGIAKLKRVILDMNALSPEMLADIKLNGGDKCSFCTYVSDFGVTDSRVWLPTEALPEFCANCLPHKPTQYESWFDDIMDSDAFADDEEEEAAPAENVRETDQVAVSEGITGRRIFGSDAEKKANNGKPAMGVTRIKDQNSSRDVTEFQAVQTCRGHPYGQVDCRKAHICDPCLQEKTSIIKHRRHEKFVPLQPAQPEIDVWGREIPRDPREKNCMVCQNLARVKCDQCPLRLCDGCETFMSALCKGYLNNLFYHYGAEHLKNDAFLLRSDGGGF